MNRYPVWKYILLVLVVFFGFLYSLPNLYKKDFAVQVSADSSHQLDSVTLDKIRAALLNQQIDYTKVDAAEEVAPEVAAIAVGIKKLMSMLLRK